MLFELNKYLILESFSLVQEDEFNRPNWGKRAAYAGAAGAGLAMANAGEFGTGVKHMVSAGKDAGQTALSGASNMVNRTSDYYKGPEAQQELGMHPNAQAAAKFAAERSAHEHPALVQPHHVVHDTASDDDDELGVLGTIGLGTVGLAGAYTAYKGAGALAHSKMGRGFRAGLNGKTVNTVSNRFGRSFHDGLAAFRK